MPLPTQNPLFVIKLRNVRHDRMHADEPSRVPRFGSNLLAHVLQPDAILIIWEKEENHRISELSGANAAYVRVARARVNQNVVRPECVRPLLFGVLEEQIPIPLL